MEKEEIKKDNQKNIEEELDVDKESSEKIENKEEEKETDPNDKVKELEEKVVRAYAEMENQRRRYEKEKDDAFEYGGFSFAKESLNLIDNLERSKTSLQNDEKLKDTEALKKIIEHLDIVYKDMITILKKNNIEPIKSINQKLDPNLHQAMMEIEDDKKEAGTIVQEIQRGFMMKERLLRPSLVCVSKKTQKKEENYKENEEIKEN
tara:strand:- start:470 stop:1087 length:618 start_codon:yes stop_codon:yes gene_type:complete